MKICRSRKKRRSSARTISASLRTGRVVRSSDWWNVVSALRNLTSFVSSSPNGILRSMGYMTVHCIRSVSTWNFLLVWFFGSVELYFQYDCTIFSHSLHTKNHFITSICIEHAKTGKIRTLAKTSAASQRSAVGSFLACLLRIHTGYPTSMAQRETLLAQRDRERTEWRKSTAGDGELDLKKITVHSYARNMWTITPSLLRNFAIYSVVS